MYSNWIRSIPCQFEQINTPFIQANFSQITIPRYETPSKTYQSLDYSISEYISIIQIINQLNTMKINPYFEVDCEKISVVKQQQEIVIRAKAIMTFSLQKSSPSGLTLLNTDALKKISEQYAELFKSEVVGPPAINNQPGPSQSISQSVQKPVQNEGNTQENSQLNSSQNPAFRNNNTHQYSFERKEDPNSSAQPNFRKNLNIFSISGQPNNFQSNSNNSNNQSSNFNFQNNPSSKESNMFYAPTSQQRPTIFDTGLSNRSSSSSDSRNRNNKAGKTRIQ